MVDTIKCPCEECISFAICYQNRNIVCKLLYSFLFDTDKLKDRAFIGYRGEGSGALSDLYNRYISSTIYPDSITLTKYRCK